MKRTLSLLIIAVIILIPAGCKNNDADPAEQVTMPTEVTRYEEMTIDDLLGIMNYLLKSEEGWEIDYGIIQVDYDQDMTEHIYIMNFDEFIIVLFSDMETDKFIGAKVSMFSMDYQNLLEITSVARVILNAIEPNTYANMIQEVMQVKESDIDPNHDYDYFGYPEEVFESYGEVWGIILTEFRQFDIFEK